MQPSPFNFIQILFIVCEHASITPPIFLYLNDWQFSLTFLFLFNYYSDINATNMVKEKRRKEKKKKKESKN
jgi:hypothetical protein